MKISVEQITGEIENEAHLEDAVQIIVHPCTNILWLFSFIDQLNGMLFDDDIRGTIVRIVHLFDHSTLISLVLHPQNISNLVIKLVFMPNTTKVVEEVPPTFVSSLPNSVKILMNSSIVPSKTLRLILAETDVAGSEQLY